MLVEQPGVHHLLDHRGGDAGAGLAVLHHHRHRDLRVVGRREADEQGVVAVPLEQLGAVVALVLLDRHHLGGTALAGDQVGRGGADLARRATGAMHHLLHAVVDAVPVGRVAQHDVGHRVGVDRRLGGSSGPCWPAARSSAPTGSASPACSPGRCRGSGSPPGTRPGGGSCASIRARASARRLRRTCPGRLSGRNRSDS